ncbi:hypothetical protein FQN54_008897 [Arachnomyces sp. PD_36]|nr:hypothetical protein FQN54_008897 [Arachnomyces sp. PD_36]
MVSKKTKSARLASSTPRPGSSCSRSASTGNDPSQDAPAQANAQAFPKNKSKRRNKKPNKPAVGSDADPEKTPESRTHTSKDGRQTAPKADHKELSKSDSGSNDVNMKQKKSCTTENPEVPIPLKTNVEKTVKKPMRGEPFIVNGIDRRSRESQMSASQTNSYASSVDNFQETGAAWPNGSGSHSLALTYTLGNTDEYNSTTIEPYQNALPALAPSRAQTHQTRPSSLSASSTSFSPIFSGSQHHDYVGRPHTAQQPPRGGYFNPGGVIFGGHFDSGESSPHHPDVVGPHSQAGAFPAHPVPHTHEVSTYPMDPRWNALDNSLNEVRGPGQFMPPEYPSVPHNEYGQPLYMPPYGYGYPPTTGILSPPLVSHQNFHQHPYSSSRSPVRYEDGNWLGHHPRHSMYHESVQSQGEKITVEPHLPFSSMGSNASPNSASQIASVDANFTNPEDFQTEQRDEYPPESVKNPDLGSTATAFQASVVEAAAPVPNTVPSLVEEMAPVHIEDRSRPDGLTGQLLDAFQTGNWADYQMVLESATDKFVPITFPLHAVVVSRSPRLNALLKTVGVSRIIRVVAEGEFLQPAAVETGLRHLYGHPLLTQQDLTCVPLFPLDMLPPASKAAQMDLALCYMVTGNFFLMPEIADQGLELAKSLMDWDTLERVMEFGTAPERFAIEDGRAASPNSLSQRADSHDDTADTSTMRSDGSCLDTTGKLMMAAFEYIASNLPANFQLDTEAHVRQMPDRLPCNPEDLRGTVLSNPDLADVKFGDFASLNERKPSRESTIVSGILLALPYSYIIHLFAVMRGKSVLSRGLADEIVVERERRRIRILRSRSINRDSEPTGDRVGLEDTNALGWEERTRTPFVDGSGGASLTRSWTGLDYVGTIRRGRSRVSLSQHTSGPRNY